MSQEGRATLKTFFETGDKPTQSQFGDLIDSQFNFTDDGTPAIIAGVNEQIQYNNAGSLGANANFTWDIVNNSLAIGNPTSITARTHIKGIGATSGTFSLKIDDSADNLLLHIRDDGLMTVKGRIFQTGLGNSTFFGEDAGLNDDLSSNFNTAIGFEASKANTTSTQNVAIGYQALLANIGDFNTAIGYQALSANIGGEQNTAVGLGALQDNTTGSTNTAIGSGALANSISGTSNTAIGKQALGLKTSGNNNTAIGDEALKNNLVGGSNVAIGKSALEFGIDSFNVAIGSSALKNTTGTNNIGLGSSAGDNITTGDENIIIGQNIDAPLVASNNQLAIGNLIFGTDVDGTGLGISTGKIGIRVNTPSATLHVLGQNGYDQLRLETPFTPANSADANGSTGDISWDVNFLYVKTAAGAWKRTALSAF